MQAVLGQENLGERDDTALQTQDSKFKPWRSEAEHATPRSRRLPTILSFTSGWGRNIFVSFKPLRPGNEPRTLAWKAAVLTTTLGPPPISFGNILVKNPVQDRKGEQWNDKLVSYVWANINPCPAELLQLYFSSFEAGIANAISSFKWRKILLFMKNRHV